ncbi:hypothetical protein [uncultured Enterovirga sp.]|uniref:hypothetical protein n=1 Tax=uncultured Enterovirga sp. TaxID=2026352 RepID=UPI0035CA348A
MAKAASFFFLNQWFYDYISYSKDGSHPPAFNRLQYLTSVTCELKGVDPTFSNIMLDSLNEQHSLRGALDGRERSDRYAKALRYARRMAGFQDYVAMVEAVCRVSEQLDTGEPD